MTDAEAKQKVRELIDSASSCVHDSTQWEWEDDPGEPSILDELVADIVAIFTAPRPAPEGTVRVRVPIIVYPDGKFFAERFSDHSDKVAEENVQALFRKPGGQIRWITATVPLPSPPVDVEGTVE